MILMVSNINWKFSTLVLLVYSISICLFGFKDKAFDLFKADYIVSVTVLVSWSALIFFNFEKVSKESFKYKLQIKRLMI